MPVAVPVLLNLPHLAVAARWRPVAWSRSDSAQVPEKNPGASSVSAVALKSQASAAVVARRPGPLVSDLEPRVKTRQVGAN